MKKILWYLGIVAMLGAQETTLLDGVKPENGVYSIPVSSKPVTYAVGAPFEIKPDENVSVLFLARAVGKSPKEFGKIMTGFRLFDAQGRKIWSIHFNRVPGSETELAVAAPKGAKTIVIPEHPAWKEAVKNNAVAAFGAKNDLSDLPNFSASNYMTKVVAVTAKEGGLEVTLARPLAAAWPKGSRVGLHAWGNENDFMFSCWPDWSFRKYTWQISGTGTSGKVIPGKWMPKAVKAQLILTFSCRQDFDGLKVELKQLDVKKTSVTSDLL